jgi:LysR family cys regulon transcriptional activator
MNFQQLRIVRETVRRKFNLTEAAEALLTSQSGVSKHIRDLEEELAIEIFVRRGKRLLGLTEPGREVAAIADRILLEADNMRQVSSHFAGSEEGTLTIATTHTQARYTLPNIVLRFKKDFPGVRLVLHQASPKDIAQLLLEGKADIGIATDTLEEAPGIVTFPYYSWEHIVVVPSGHALLSSNSLTLDALAEFPIITYDEGLTGRRRIDQAFEDVGVVPDIAMTALDADVIKAYVELGLGIGIIASIAFNPDRDKGLSQLGSEPLFKSNPSSLAIRRGRFLRSYVYRFIEMCSPALNENFVREAEARGPVAEVD